MLFKLILDAYMAEKVAVIRKSCSNSFSCEQKVL